MGGTHRCDIETFGTVLETVVNEFNDQIKHQMGSRGYRAANELRNASQLVLRGQRSGRRYNVPGTGSVRYYKRTKTAKITYKKYTASAPGEPPAVRTGAFRMSWQPKAAIEQNGDAYQVRSIIESTQRTDNGKYLLGKILEEGTGRMAPRPHQEKIQEKALPAIRNIYSEPYV